MLLKKHFTLHFFRDSLIKNIYFLKEQHLFEAEIFCNKWLVQFITCHFWIILFNIVNVLRYMFFLFLFEQTKSKWLLVIHSMPQMLPVELNLFWNWNMPLNVTNHLKQTSNDYLIHSLHPFRRESLRDTDSSLWIQTDAWHQGHTVISQLKDNEKWWQTSHFCW